MYVWKDINYLTATHLFGERVTKNTWKYANYQLDTGEMIVVLINNDIEKLVRIKQYLEVNKYNRSNKNNIIAVCLKEQEQSLKNELTGVEIKTIGISELIYMLIALLIYIIMFFMLQEVLYLVFEITEMPINKCRFHVLAMMTYNK